MYRKNYGGTSTGVALCSAELTIDSGTVIIRGGTPGRSEFMRTLYTVRELIRTCIA